MREYGLAPTGYRLPRATRLGRVALQVGDMERSLRYYQEVLGLRVIDRTDDRAALASHGEEEVLVELRERVGARPVPASGRLGLYHYAILLPSRPALGAFVRHLAERGMAAGMADHAVSEAVYLSDPDGLGIEVYADRPRNSWSGAGDGELYMTTEALDAADLVRAAGDEHWAGMPAGTRIGHVHLFVDDLDKASAFYHDGLGFDKMVWSYRGALFLSAGGYHHHLGTNTWAARAPRATQDDARLLEWEILVPTRGDALEAARSMEARGSESSVERPGFTAVDPWGTPVRVRGLRE